MSAVFGTGYKRTTTGIRGGRRKLGRQAGMFFAYLKHQRAWHRTVSVTFYNLSSKSVSPKVMIWMLWLPQFFSSTLPPFTTRQMYVTLLFPFTLSVWLKRYSHFIELHTGTFSSRQPTKVLVTPSHWDRIRPWERGFEKECLSQDAKIG